MIKLRTLTFAVLLLLTGSALADQAEPPSPATAPAGWTRDREHGAVVRRGIARALADSKNFDAMVFSYRAPKDPSRGGGQLIVSVIDVPVADGGASLIRRRLNDLRDTGQVMANSGGRVRGIAWKESTDDQGRVVDALLEWAHEDNGTHSLVRAAWVKLAGAAKGQGEVIVEVRVECVLAADAVTALRPACLDAMASMLMPEPSARLPITVDPETPETADGTTTPPPVTEPVTTDPPVMRETPAGTQVPARDAAAAEPSKRDLRPFYVVGVLLLLFAFLWWNRQRRSKLAQEDDAAAPPDADADADAAADADPAPDSDEEKP